MGELVVAEPGWSRRTGTVRYVTFAIRLQLEEKYVDYLGHVTAAAHLVLLEEAHTQWLASVTEEELPSFVLAHLELDYRRELLLTDGPVTVRLRPLQMGRSSVVVDEQIRGADGDVRSEARVVLVRWDRDRRCATVFSDAERALIEVQLGGG